jgi:hypothetical protein
MEKLAEAVSAMNRLELQMTKDVDTVRRGLFDTQTEQQETAATHNHGPAATDDVSLPARILQIREARRRLEVPEIASSTAAGGETEDF